MDVGKSFTYMFEDKDWVTKIAVGGLVVLLSFLIVPIPLLIGYSLEVIKRVAENHPMPLPDWNNISELYMKGLMAFVGSLIYAAPVIVLVFCTIIPIFLLQRDGDGARQLGVLLIFCSACVMLILGLAIGFLQYVPMTMFALNNQINSLLSGNIISLVTGILALVFYDNPKVKEYFARVASQYGAVPSNPNIPATSLTFAPSTEPLDPTTPVR